MDAFSGYHQIFVDPADKEKTTFICIAGVYNYKMMPFGLKNAGATYQRLMDQIFASQKGRNLEVYVDDSIVKSKKEENLIPDLNETFGNMRKHNMRLNPKKCIFWIKARKFLGFMVSQRGIYANPAKVQAVLDLAESKSKKDVMKLTGRMTSLSRFIAKAAKNPCRFLRCSVGIRISFGKTNRKRLSKN